MNKVYERIHSLTDYGLVLEQQWQSIRSTFTYKIIVLDDDPTGVQTVHDIPVFTDWSEDTIQNIFLERRELVFLLTNSRSFSREKTIEVHTTIAERIAKVSKEFNQPFLLLSRSDSTLRGHYPTETEVLKDSIEKASDFKYDGEIIIPFFQEGGRLTIDDVHYVQQGEQFIPAGNTEFASDRMFGFKSSNLREYVEEKTAGRFLAKSVKSVSLDELRALDVEGITLKLESLTDFQKMVVNAVSEEDLRVFSIAIIQAIKKGKQFLFRTGASFTKVIGAVSNQPLLKREDLVDPSNRSGGFIVVGSHVQKTTDQLTVLKKLKAIEFVEFDVKTVLNDDVFATEIERVQRIVNSSMAKGKTVCVYTSRKRLDLGEDHREEELALSVKISDAMTQLVSECEVEPKYVIAKGGITSSDVGVKGLKVKKAEVMGQIALGVPVWKTGEEARFPNIPYIIFPGNVGNADTLLEVVKKVE